MATSSPRICFPLVDHIENQQAGNCWLHCVLTNRLAAAAQRQRTLQLRPCQRLARVHVREHQSCFQGAVWVQPPLKHCLYGSAAWAGRAEGRGVSGVAAPVAAVLPAQARQRCSGRHQSWQATSYWRGQAGSRGSGRSSLGGLGQRKYVLDGSRIVFETQPLGHQPVWKAHKANSPPLGSKAVGGDPRACTACCRVVLTPLSTMLDA